MIVIDEFTATRVHAITLTLRSGEALKNLTTGTWAWSVTISPTLGYSGTAATRAEALDAMCAQLVA